jgi:hypothetical protein
VRGRKGSISLFGRLKGKHEKISRRKKSLAENRQSTKSGIHPCIQMHIGEE